MNKEVITAITHAVLVLLLTIAVYVFLSYVLASCVAIVLGMHFTFKHGVALFTAIIIAGIAWYATKREVE